MQALEHGCKGLLQHFMPIISYSFQLSCKFKCLNFGLWTTLASRHNDSSQCNSVTTKECTVRALCKSRFSLQEALPPPPTTKNLGLLLEGGGLQVAYFSSFPLSLFTSFYFNLLFSFLDNWLLFFGGQISVCFFLKRFIHFLSMVLDIYT